MAEDANGAVELIEFDRLLDHSDRATGEDLTKNLTIWVARDDYDGHVRVELF